MKTYKNIITAFLLLFSAELLATADSDYALGLEAYKGGDNAAAVRYFESAMTQGMDSVSLQYNLASSYYRVGRYEEAKKYFTLLNETMEMRDIAQYHLGLIAIKQQDADLARQHFNAVVSSAKDEKLVKLSNKHLLALSDKEDQWKTRLAYNLGHDDNISAVSEDTVLGTADSFHELSASTNLLISGRRKDGWMADAALYGINYSDTDSYDQYVFALGLKRAIKFADWETSAHLNLSKSTYGGDALQTITRLDFTGMKPLSKTERIKLRYRVEDITSDQSIYDYLAGWRQRASIEYQSFSNINIRQLQYEFELNSRGELVTTAGAYDYSPTRHTVRGIYTHFITRQWWLIGDVSYRMSNFPASATVDRDDKQWLLALSSDYRFDPTLKLTAKYQYTNNASTLDQYDYDKSVIRIGLSKLF